MITVFTPTFNRANTLPRLYESLRNQDCFNFEWLVINDGSTDGTDELFKNWLEDNNRFVIRYYVVKNGGKQRAINKALALAAGDFFFIVDSDDSLAPDAISFIISGFHSLPQDDYSFIGISALKVSFDGKYLNQRPLIDSSIGYVDCNNIERPIYNLQADMAEVFFTSKLQKYKFPVWANEYFTPEAVVWDQIAIDGFKLRWFEKSIYFCEYQPDGLTNSSWSLLKRNPMGYAMLYNTRLKYIKSNRIITVIQFVSCCCLAKEYNYLARCNSRLVFLLFPIGWLLSIRRKMQIKHYS